MLFYPLCPSALLALFFQPWCTGCFEHAKQSKTGEDADGLLYLYQSDTLSEMLENINLCIRIRETISLQVHISEPGSCQSQVSCMFRKLTSVTSWRNIEIFLPLSSGGKTLFCCTSCKTLFLNGWFHKQGFRGIKGEKGEPGLPGLDGLDAPCPVVWCSFFPFTSMPLATLNHTPLYGSYSASL